MPFIYRIDNLYFFYIGIFLLIAFPTYSFGQLSAGLGLAAESSNELGGIQFSTKYNPQNSPLGFSINGIYFFPDEIDEQEIDAWELNANVHYHIDVRFIFTPYIFTGLNYYTQTLGDESENNIGFNIGFGLESDSDYVRFFSELNAIIQKHSRISAVIGLRFPL